jgi:hypothetical protein
VNKMSKGDNLYTVIKNIDISFIAKLVFFISLVFIVYINVINTEQPILEQHGFRQTQTALTSYYLKSEGFRLDYQTPVSGEPWSIPFEFPIYQQIVASTSDLMGTSLTATGRFINLLFVLFTCIPIYFSLTRLHLQKSAIYFSLALYLSSPVYLFWAGTFMIEGAALFFACCFLYYAITISQRDWRNKNFILLSFFLALALLQKITTASPILLVVLLALSLFTVRRRDFNENLSSLLKLTVSICLPILIYYFWDTFSESVRMKNPIVANLTLNNLHEWIWGTLEQRLSKELWLDVVFDRNIKKASFFLFGSAFVFTSILLVKDKTAKMTAIISFVLFLLPFLIFPNLHVVHNYYQNSNSVFLSISVGISVVYVCNHFLKRRSGIYGVVLLSFILSNFYFFYKDYLPAKTWNITRYHMTLYLSDFIKNHTLKDRPVIWYGYNWSSEAAFYSERKSLTLPNWGGFYLDVIVNTKRYLKDQPSAIVLCNPGKGRDLIRRAIGKKYGKVDVQEIAGCDVYLLPANWMSQQDIADLSKKYSLVIQNVQFDNTFKVHALSLNLGEGETTVRLWWEQMQNSLGKNWWFIFHLIDCEGNIFCTKEIFANLKPESAEKNIQFCMTELKHSIDKQVKTFAFGIYEPSTKAFLHADKGLRDRDNTLVLVPFSVVNSKISISSDNATEIVRKSDSKYRDIAFGDKFILLGANMVKTADGLKIRLVWRSITEERLSYAIAIHLVDSRGNILYQADYAQDKEMSIVKPGTLWLDKIDIPHSKLENVASVGIGIYTLNPDVQLLSVDKGPRDWDGKRLLITLLGVH